MRIERINRKLVLCLVCAVLLFIILLSNDNQLRKMASFFDSDLDISCYEQPSSNNNAGLSSFDSLSDNEKPSVGKNIFFHETSCFGEQGIEFNVRKACAVESAARMNPQMKVFLLFLSPATVSNNAKALFNILSSYSNIRINRIFPEVYVRDTPLEEWYIGGEALHKSLWPRSHMSDILRYLTLWKYGGIYLDLDVVVTSSLNKSQNFAGAEDWKAVAAGVIGLGMDKLGRHMADACIEDLMRNFRGNVWGNNGPGVITRTLKTLCNTTYVARMTERRCKGFIVHSPSVFYPIHYKKWKAYFDEENRNLTMQKLQRSLAIHVWNKLSRMQLLDVDSNAPYATIARAYCPKVFGSCKKTF
ncbi:lactosylceramide 4-alpha-galactosyltransferase-like [Prorops nasuta]|uniref:lactosylceramide 4-alpha-galactosyltransferase-like n=1 Tax=Prorops nasuta TaxID=863751 RepID=UPI0034CE95AD